MTILLMLAIGKTALATGDWAIRIMCTEPFRSSIASIAPQVLSYSNATVQHVQFVPCFQGD